MSVGAPRAPSAPDLIEPVVGYRQWRLYDARLWSPFKDYAWRRGVNAARCTLGAGHAEPAPGHECACGLHAWYRPCPRLGYATPDLVAGAVALWGDVELHPTGLRAQYAAIVALVLPLARTAKRRRVIDVADSLEVDAVPARELKTVALHHAAPIPPGLAPKAR
jgi:hypothetical protein